MYKRILIATDGSELSDKAVESGLSLAALTGAAVVALKVVPRYPRSYFEGGLPVDASDIRRIEKQWGDAAQTMVDAIKSQAPAAGQRNAACADAFAHSSARAALISDHFGLWRFPIKRQ